MQQVANLEGTSQQRIDGMFWNQGDSDASGQAIMRDSYGSNLINFVDRLWTDLKACSPILFPFIPLQLHWKVYSEDKKPSKSTKQYLNAMTKVNEAMRKACDELGPAARMATISREMEATIASMIDDGHSGTGALLLEGQLLANTFIDVLHLQKVDG